MTLPGRGREAPAHHIPTRKDPTSMLTYEFPYTDRPQAVRRTYDTYCGQAAPNPISGWACSVQSGVEHSLHVAMAPTSSSDDEQREVCAIWGTTSTLSENPADGVSRDLALALIPQHLTEHPERRTPGVPAGSRVRVLRTRAVESAIQESRPWVPMALTDLHLVGTVIEAGRPDRDGDFMSNGRYISSWEPVGEPVQEAAEDVSPPDAVAAAERRAEAAEQKLADLWAALGREAEDREWCSDYDAFATEHGGPPRMETVSRAVHVTEIRTVRFQVPRGTPVAQVAEKALEESRQQWPGAHEVTLP